MKELSGETWGHFRTGLWGFLPLQQHFAGSSLRTLNAEHLSYLQRGSADFTQRVDDSLGVGLRQEGRVQQGAHVWDRTRERWSALAQTGRLDGANGAVWEGWE